MTKKAPSPKPRGRRPMPFDQVRADEICERISHGESLLSIVGDEKMPSFPTVYKWMEANQSFAENYVRAKDVYAEQQFEVMQDIADNGSNDWMERQHFHGADKSWEVNGEAIARSRLRIDTIKWRLGKLRPKKYGDRMIMAGDEEMPIEVNVTIGGQKP